MDLGKGPSARTWLLALLCLIPALLGGYKVVSLRHTPADLLPRTRYDVAFELRFDGHDGPVKVRTFLPSSDGHQEVTDEQSNAPGLHFDTELDGLDRVGTWSGARVHDDSTARYAFSVVTKRMRYELPPDLVVPAAYPPALADYLRPEEDIQVDHPEIEAYLARIGANHGTVAYRLRRIYEATASLGSRPFKGTTDALTALRLGEASCNGKSRLFVALARAAGIPARLVGGIILERGHKRTSHQWVETWVNGVWVPSCPTNEHFAELPETYLTLYRGDEVLFRHTADINFDHTFATSTTLVPSDKALAAHGRFDLWSLFERLALPTSLLRTLLMLPVGALVVVFFRNVVGLPTFGTFLPALIAAAAGSTGLGWGLVGLGVVIAMAVLVRAAVQRLRLLHSPSLAILLAAVSTTLLGISWAADNFGFGALAHMAVFPIAVLAITAERFYLSLAEKGPRTAMGELGGTLVVISVCYLVMNSLALQLLVLGFPEILLLVVAADLYLGRWVGMRVSEYTRFQSLMLDGGEA